MVDRPLNFTVRSQRRAVAVITLSAILSALVLAAVGYQLIQWWELQQSLRKIPRQPVTGLTALVGADAEVVEAFKRGGPTAPAPRCHLQGRAQGPRCQRLWVPDVLPSGDEGGPMRQRRRSLLSSALFAICVAGPAVAADPLGLYAGAAVGQAQIAIDVSDPFVTLSDRFEKNHFAFKIMVGLRPISLLGAELSYMDFGHPSGTLFGHPADASMRGVSVFGILYLPVPIIDVFAKAGVAHIQSATSGSAPVPSIVCCATAPFQLDRTNTSFAAGAGAQLRIGRLAARAEYERFNAAGENPYLLSLGLTWSFF